MDAVSFASEDDELPHADGAYIKGYSRPMPKDAVYKKDGRCIRCIQRVPGGVLVTNGVINYDFGTLANIQHGVDFDHQVAAVPGQPITFAEAKKLMKL